MLHTTTTDFEALSISNSNSFVEDQVLPEITFEENQIENDYNDRQSENDNNDSHFENNSDSQFENDNNDSQFENDNNDSQFESTPSNNMSISCDNVSVNTSRNWKPYREAKESKLSFNRSNN